MGRQEDLPLTTDTGMKRFEISTRLATKTIDMIALAASFGWLGAMLCLSLRGDESSILAWLIRGMWGAIFIYACVFLVLHAATSKTISSKEESPAIKKADAASAATEPVEQAAADLQAVDSGELAKVVERNVSEQL